MASADEMKRLSIEQATDSIESKFGTVLDDPVLLRVAIRLSKPRGITGAMEDAFVDDAVWIVQRPNFA